MSTLSRNEAISVGRALARALRETGVTGLSRRQRGELRALAVDLRQRDDGWQEALRVHLQSQFGQQSGTALMTAGPRQAEVSRSTAETNVSLRLNVDGSGQGSIHTGIGMLDHLLRQLAFHGLLDLEVIATGDIEVDAHHLTEDVALTLGRALDQALGGREGIQRFAVDLGGRGVARIDVAFLSPSIGQLPSSLIRHFLDSLAREARLTLHARLEGHLDDHHGAEALFKALGRALAAAAQPDPRRAGHIPSTKATI
jgi:imidazoleglycerol-phosphate dehydratase